MEEEKYKLVGEDLLAGIDLINGKTRGYRTWFLDWNSAAATGSEWAAPFFAVPEGTLRSGKKYLLKFEAKLYYVSDVRVAVKAMEGKKRYAEERFTQSGKRSLVIKMPDVGYIGRTRIVVTEGRVLENSEYAEVGVKFQNVSLYEINPPKPNFDTLIKPDKSAVKAGESVNFTISFTNTGETSLHNITIASKLPDGLKFVDGSLKSAAKFTGSLHDGVLLTEVGAGKKVALDFAATTDLSKLVYGNNELIATVSASTKELAHEDKALLDNNSAKITVDYPAPKPNFDVSIVADKSTINIGDSVNYTIEFSNTGEVDLHNVNVTSTLPAGLKLVEGSVKSGAKFTGTLAGGLLLTEVKAGDKATITFATTTVKGKLKYGNNELSTSVSATTKELATEDSALLGNNTAKITVVYPKPQPKFNLALEADNLAIKITETAKLTATFTNTGETDLHNTVVTAVLPAGLSLSGAIESKETTGDLQPVSYTHLTLPTNREV